MRKILFAFAGLLTVFTSYAQHPGAGTGYFPLLSVEYDARSAAMAGASVALPNGISGILSNPATLAGIDHIQAFLGYRTMYGLWGGPVSFGRSMGKYGFVAANITGVSSGDIPVVADINGEPVETDLVAGDNFLSGGLTWAYRVMDELALGVTARGVYQKITVPDQSYSAKGASFDAGVFYSLWRGRFTTGAVVRNLFFYMRGFDQNEYEMPFTAEVGISYVPRYIPAMRIALDMNKQMGDYINFEPGLELDIYKKTLALRLGYAFSQRDFQELVKSLSGNKDEDYIKSNMKSLCMGIGLNTKIEKTDLQVDFALQLNTKLPPTVLISALVDL